MKKTRRVGTKMARGDPQKNTYYVQYKLLKRSKKLGALRASKNFKKRSEAISFAKKITKLGGWAQVWWVGNIFNHTLVQYW